MRTVSIYVVLALAAGLWSPLNSILIKQLLNLLPTGGGDISALILPASLLVINFVVFDNLVWRGVNYIWATLAPLVVRGITEESLNYVLSHSPRFYQENLSGNVAKQISTLTDTIIRIMTFTSINFLRGDSLLLATFVTAYLVNPIFGIILITWFVFLQA